MKVKPLHDNVLIEPLTEELSSKTGIVLPDTIEKEKPEKGKIIEIGTGVVDSNGNKTPLNVSVGQTVLFKKYSPEELTIEDKKYLMISEKDILAILE